MSMSVRMRMRCSVPRVIYCIGDRSALPTFLFRRLGQSRFYLPEVGKINLSYLTV